MSPSPADVENGWVFIGGLCASGIFVLLHAILKGWRCPMFRSKQCRKDEYYER